MSETTPDTGSTYLIARNSQQEPHSHSAGHTAGTSTRPACPNRSHHRGSNPSRRPPVSEEQRQKLSAAQKAYVANDPRWPEHRRKLAAAQEAKRMTLEKVRALVQAIKTGDPNDPSTVNAPVINQAAVDRIMGMIERAIADGATLVVGGKRMDRPGYYIEPTVFTDVDPSSELAQNEVFGPVLAITKFATDEEAIAIANSTRHGLASYIQTNDIARALQIAAELDAGEVLVNGAANVTVHRPFGGFGISGVGKEGGRIGFEEFLQIKTVVIAVR
jgi:acyl-CoA reductase-like NAD-dependent aldehyde dehydrogenase